MVLPPGRLAETPNVQDHTTGLYSQEACSLLPLLGFPLWHAMGSFVLGPPSHSRKRLRQWQTGEEKGLMGGTSGDVRKRGLL